MTGIHSSSSDEISSSVDLSTSIRETFRSFPWVLEVVYSAGRSIYNVFFRNGRDFLFGKGLIPVKRGSDVRSNLLNTSKLHASLKTVLANL